MSVCTEFPIRLKITRQTKNMTLKQLASASGVSKGYLSGLERGKYSPSLSVLESLANGLGISITQLLTGK